MKIIGKHLISKKLLVLCQFIIDSLMLVIVPVMIGMIISAVFSDGSFSIYIMYDAIPPWGKSGACYSYYLPSCIFCAAGVFIINRISSRERICGYLVVELIVFLLLYFVTPNY